jgi:NAD(P)-dependent dehydrogenase (short-subunit alcohol dehydrogenase family)
MPHRTPRPRAASSHDAHDRERTRSGRDHRQLRAARCDTDRYERALYEADIVAALKERIPLQEIAEFEWIAAAICYFASDEARYTTGAALDVDGGYAMNGALPGTVYR